MNTGNNRNIIILGPYGSGKTTLAEYLENKLELTRYSLDELLHKYLKRRNDYSEIETILQQEPLLSNKIEPYFIYMVKAFFEEVEQQGVTGIVEFGYRHGLYENSHYFHQLTQILRPYNNIFYLSPSPDKNEAIDLLVSNVRSHPLKRFMVSESTIRELNDYALAIYAQHNPAKHYIYTKGKSVEETGREVIELLIYQ